MLSFLCLQRKVSLLIVSLGNVVLPVSSKEGFPSYVLCLRTEEHFLSGVLFLWCQGTSYREECLSSLCPVSACWWTLRRNVPFLLSPLSPYIGGKWLPPLHTGMTVSDEDWPPRWQWVTRAGQPFDSAGSLPSNIYNICRANCRLMWQRLSRLSRCRITGLAVLAMAVSTPPLPPLLCQTLLVILRLLGDGRPGDCRSRGSEVCCYYDSSILAPAVPTSPPAPAPAPAPAAPAPTTSPVPTPAGILLLLLLHASQGRWTGPLDWLTAWLRFRLPTVLQHTGELGDVDVDVDVDVVSARHSVYSDSVIYWLLSPTGCSPAKPTVTSTALSSSVGKTWSGVVEVQDFCLLSADRLRGEEGDDWAPGHVDVVVLSALILHVGDWLVSRDSCSQSVVGELGEVGVEVASYQATREA